MTEEYENENAERVEHFCSRVMLVPKYLGREGRPGDKPARASDVPFHWKVELTFDEGRTFECDYWQGSAHAGKTRKSPHDVRIRNKYEDGDEFAYAPEIQSVLNSLQLDASVPDRFEEFASDFGYDVDSRKAEALHKTCLDTRLKLLTFFGREFHDFIGTNFDA